MRQFIEYASRAIALVLLVATAAAAAAVIPRLLEILGLWLFAGVALLLMLSALLSPTE